MTLTKEQREAYGEDWPFISAGVRKRAGDRCECLGECGWSRHQAAIDAEDRDDPASVDDPDKGGPISMEDGRCPALNGQPSPFTGSTVVLTVAHLDHNGHEAVHTIDRLKAMCQGCHLAYDRAHRNTGGPS
jgi:5-methylcytosine-specific restriction endonuclease McrA